MEFDYGTVMRVRENRLIIRNEPVLPWCRPKREKENLREDRKKAYSGYLSVSAKREIEKRLQCWFGAIFLNNKENVKDGKVRPYMPVMITVTLSDFQVHDDKYIKRHMLQEFLKALSRKKNIKYTFWKAEAQQNGNIHFHILVDRFVDKKFVQGLWNYYQAKHGYLDRYKEIHGNLNAPSTKITGMVGNRSPISYVLKYIQKTKIYSQKCMHTEKGCLRVCEALKNIRRPVDGAIFRFSSALVLLTPEPLFTSPTLNEHLSKKIDEGKLKLALCDHCVVLYCRKCKAYDQLTKYYKDQIDIFNREVFRTLYLVQNVDLGSIKQHLKGIKESIKNYKQLNFELN